jgi:hypothetical protein
LGLQLKPNGHLRFGVGVLDFPDLSFLTFCVEKKEKEKKRKNRNMGQPSGWAGAEIRANV